MTVDRHCTEDFTLLVYLFVFTCTHCAILGTVAQNPAGNSKTLRLFGVNMECQLDGFKPLMSSHGQAHGYSNQQQFNYSQVFSSNRRNYMVGS